MPEKNEHGLYPCPYCGNPNVYPEATSGPVKGLKRMYYIHCGIWDCNRPYATFHETEQEAIDAWNIDAECEILAMKIISEFQNYKEENNEN